MANMKIDTAQRMLNFQTTVTTPGVTQISYIDIGQALSMVNRRFYRQGMQYMLANIRIQTFSATPAGISIKKLPETWVLGASWEKTMLHWRKQQDEALANSGSEETKGRYNDYKIFFNQAHYDIWITNNLKPLDAASVAYRDGEWLYSEIVIPNDGGVVGNTVEYAVKALGDDSSSVKGMIYGYGKSRNKPRNPDPQGGNVGDSWLSEMFDVGENSEEVTDNAQFRNDHSPYDMDVYPGEGGNGINGELFRTLFFTGTTLSQTQNTGGLLVPCGLLEISYDQDVRITLELVPGPYKGVLAESVAEMN